jgi:hypothetical protein
MVIHLKKQLKKEERMTYKRYPSLIILLSLTFSYPACGSDQFFLNEDATKETLHPALSAIVT